NETTRLQARVDAFLEALGCQLCPEDALATIDLKNAALEAYEARVEQLERERTTLLEQKDAARDEYEKLLLSRDALTQERARMIADLECDRSTMDAAISSAQDRTAEAIQYTLKVMREAEALRTALRELLEFLRQIFGPKYDQTPILVNAEAALSGEQPDTPETRGSLLQKPNENPSAGCFCAPGNCGAPRVMGRQAPCRDPEKASRCPHCGKPKMNCDCAPDSTERPDTLPAQTSGRVVEEKEPSVIQSAPCPECYGTGGVAIECPTCKGTGVQS